MITIRLDAAAVSRVRVAVSPVMEAVGLLRLAAAGRAHPIFGDPGAAARFALRDPDVRAVAAALGTEDAWDFPDLLTPRPLPVRDVLSDQLERLRATDEARVEAQLTDMHRLRRWIPTDGFPARAAAGLARFFAVAMADQWPAHLTMLEGDVRDRAVQMATGGVGALLSSLHTRATWTGEAVLVRCGSEVHVDSTGQELVIAPSAMCWPDLLVQSQDPTDVVLFAPARSLGTPRPHRGVDRLIGPTRARLLNDLETPRSTGELAARHSLAAATVSHHLSVLHESGQVTRHRDGRRVFYQRADARVLA
ncbi:ArsR/SmtB family transcription factor [Actinokineospora bangkokensis]|uniref:HTH arsR-type domain-containing protein n=1 Tax=Actinokineospora bangkokensis TaxID=1193682 RepID=A0A1Q9LDP1_9PSEU|nr:helix-turn-helix domain-containing protein [Actinokineospora bangkokensis]OLR90119.1 hypothetical protein BJP25_03865 [Actinokineospora bangkokensis]